MTGILKSQLPIKILTCFIKIFAGTINSFYILAFCYGLVILKLKYISPINVLQTSLFILYVALYVYHMSFMIPYATTDAKYSFVA